MNGMDTSVPLIPLYMHTLRGFGDARILVGEDRAVKGNSCRNKSLQVTVLVGIYLSSKILLSIKIG